MVLGWGRALLWQLAHPLIAVAVAVHSDFSHSLRAAWRRFARTVQAMRRLSFGTTEEADEVARWIQRAHQRVQGTLPEPMGPFAAGTVYRAGDPALLTWVHVTTVEATLYAYEIFVQPLQLEERDRYCQGAQAMERWLGLPADTFPGSWRQLVAYFEAMQASRVLQVTLLAQQVATHVLSPTRQWWGQPFTKPWRLLTLGLLPSELRTAYGFCWTEREEQAFQRLVKAIRWGVAWAPFWMRTWPEARRGLRQSTLASR